MSEIIRETQQRQQPTTDEPLTVPTIETMQERVSAQEPDASVGVPFTAVQPEQPAELPSIPNVNVQVNEQPRTVLPVEILDQFPQVYSGQSMTQRARVFTPQVEAFQLPTTEPTVVMPIEAQVPEMAVSRNTNRFNELINPLQSNPLYRDRPANQRNPNYQGEGAYPYFDPRQGEYGDFGNHPWLSPLIYGVQLVPMTVWGAIVDATRLTATTGQGIATGVSTLREGGTFGEAIVSGRQRYREEFDATDNPYMLPYWMLPAAGVDLSMLQSRYRENGVLNPLGILPQPGTYDRAEVLPDTTQGQAASTIVQNILNFTPFAPYVDVVSESLRATTGVRLEDTVGTWAEDRVDQLVQDPQTGLRVWAAAIGDVVLDPLGTPLIDVLRIGSGSATEVVEQLALPAARDFPQLPGTPPDLPQLPGYRVIERPGTEPAGLMEGAPSEWIYNNPFDPTTRGVLVDPPGQFIPDVPNPVVTPPIPRVPQIRAGYDMVENPWNPNDLPWVVSWGNTVEMHPIVVPPVSPRQLSGLEFAGNLPGTPPDVPLLPPPSQRVSRFLEDYPHLQRYASLDTSPPPTDVWNELLPQRLVDAQRPVDAALPPGTPDTLLQLPESVPRPIVPFDSLPPRVIRVTREQVQNLPQGVSADLVNMLEVIESEAPETIPLTLARIQSTITQHREIAENITDVLREAPESEVFDRTTGIIIDDDYGTFTYQQGRGTLIFETNLDNENTIEAFAAVGRSLSNRTAQRASDRWVFRRLLRQFNQFRDSFRGQVPIVATAPNEQRWNMYQRFNGMTPIRLNELNPRGFEYVPDAQHSPSSTLLLDNRPALLRGSPLNYLDQIENIVPGFSLQGQAQRIESTLRVMGQRPYRSPEWFHAANTLNLIARTRMRYVPEDILAVLRSFEYPNNISWSQIVPPRQLRPTRGGAIVLRRDVDQIGRYVPQYDTGRSQRTFHEQYVLDMLRGLFNPEVIEVAELTRYLPQLPPAMSSGTTEANNLTHSLLQSRHARSQVFNRVRELENTVRNLTQSAQDLRRVSDTQLENNFTEQVLPMLRDRVRVRRTRQIYPTIDEIHNAINDITAYEVNSDEWRDEVFRLRRSIQQQTTVTEDMEDFLFYADNIAPDTRLPTPRPIPAEPRPETPRPVLRERPLEDTTQEVAQPPPGDTPTPTPVETSQTPLNDGTADNIIPSEINNYISNNIEDTNTPGSGLPAEETPPPATESINRAGEGVDRFDGMSYRELQRLTREIRERTDLRPSARNKESLTRFVREHADVLEEPVESTPTTTTVPDEVLPDDTPLHPIHQMWRDFTDEFPEVIRPNARVQMDEYIEQQNWQEVFQHLQELSHHYDIDLETMSFRQTPEVPASPTNPQLASDVARRARSEENITDLRDDEWFRIREDRNVPTRDLTHFAERFNIPIQNTSIPSDIRAQIDLAVVGGLEYDQFPDRALLRNWNYILDDNFKMEALREFVERYPELNRIADNIGITLTSNKKESLRSLIQQAVDNWILDYADGAFTVPQSPSYDTSTVNSLVERIVAVLPDSVDPAEFITALRGNLSPLDVNRETIDARLGLALRRVLPRESAFRTNLADSIRTNILGTPTGFTPDIRDIARATEDYNTNLRRGRVEEARRDAQLVTQRTRDSRLEDLQDAQRDLERSTNDLIQTDSQLRQQVRQDHTQTEQALREQSHPTPTEPGITRRQLLTRYATDPRIDPDFYNEELVRLLEDSEVLQEMWDRVDDGNILGLYDTAVRWLDENSSLPYTGEFQEMYWNFAETLQDIERQLGNRVEIIELPCQ